MTCTGLRPEDLTLEVMYYFLRYFQKYPHPIILLGGQCGVKVPIEEEGEGQATKLRQLTDKDIYG